MAAGRGAVRGGWAASESWRLLESWTSQPGAQRHGVGVRFRARQIWDGQREGQRPRDAETDERSGARVAREAAVAELVWAGGWRASECE